MDKEKECIYVQALLPLYLEECLDPRTGDLVQAHIQSCDHCHSVYKTVQAEQIRQKQTSADPQEPQPAEAFVSLHKRLRKKKTFTMVSAFLLAMIVSLLGFGILTARIPLSADQVIAAITEDGDTTWVQAYGRATAIEIISPEENVYEMTGTTSVWDQLFQSEEEKNILHPAARMEKGQTWIYASRSDDSADTVLQGREDVSDAAISLPRLTFNYYLLIAGGLAVVTGAAFLVFKNRLSSRNQQILLAAFCLPFFFVLFGLLFSAGGKPLWYMGKTLCVTCLTSLCTSVLVTLWYHNRMEKKLTA